MAIFPSLRFRGVVRESADRARRRRPSSPPLSREQLESRRLLAADHYLPAPLPPPPSAYFEAMSEAFTPQTTPNAPAVNIAPLASLASSVPSGLSLYWHYLTHPTQMDDDLEYSFNGSLGVGAVAGTAAGGLAIAGVEVVLWGGGATAAAAGGGAAAGGVIGAQAVVAPGLGAGTYPALIIDGIPYVARFHIVAWELAGKTGVETFYGAATIDAAGRVIELIK